MLEHIKPQPKHSKKKGGSLSMEEKPLAKGLLALGYRAQDITYIINQGRKFTVNQARVSQVESDKKVKPAETEFVKNYLKIQSLYDPKTLLNPYKDERLIRAREAMIAAVQVFNNPGMIFRAELFSVLSNIAWTYLIHEKIENENSGASLLPTNKSISVNAILDKQICPINDAAIKENLRKVIEIRDAVEHTFFVGGSECFGPLFQSCCINFEKCLTEWFGKNLSLAKELSLALQFVRLEKNQVIEMEKSNLPEKIRAISESIHNSEFANNNSFQLNVFYTKEISSKSNADLHKLIDSDDFNKNQNITVIKKQDYNRLTQEQIVDKIKNLGFKNFKAQDHRVFWLQKWENAADRNKNGKKFGEILLKNQWMWYEQNWLPEVLKHCQSLNEKFI